MPSQLERENDSEYQFVLVTTSSERKRIHTSTYGMLHPAMCHLIISQVKSIQCSCVAAIAGCYCYHHIAQFGAICVIQSISDHAKIKNITTKSLNRCWSWIIDLHNFSSQHRYKIKSGVGCYAKAKNIVKRNEWLKK